MKFRHEKVAANFKHLYILEIDDEEIVTYKSSHFEMLAEQIAKKSGLISDKLMYLSELVKSIEDSQHTDSRS